MPINNLHPEYSANIDRWVRSRDAYLGGDAIKAGGERYLPRIPGQVDAEYTAYQGRPCYYELVSRTIDGLIGAVTRLPHSFDLPTEIVGMLTEASKDGLTIDELIKGLLAECLLQGRAGVLVDIDEATQTPYLTVYGTECITNWSLDFIILHESVLEPDPLDEFKLLEVEQYRQLHIVEGAYTVTVWRKNATKSTWYVLSEVVPTRRGKPLDFIPFSFVTPAGCTTRVQRPPLLGVVDLALQHYRVSADLFQALFYSAIPTLYVAGIKDDRTIQVGGAAAILLEDANAKVGYVEFTGSGVGSIRNALEDIERRAGSLGASILLAEKERNETATAATIRSSNQTALLSATVFGVQDALIRSLKIAAFWAGAPENAKLEVKLNSEFLPARLDAQMVASLVQAYQAGAVSLAAFQAALADGGVIDQSATTA